MIDEALMTSPLSQDLRERLVATVEAGSSRRQAAARFAVSPSAAVKLLQRVRATGSTAPGQIGGHRRAKLEGHEDYLRELTETRKGITLEEIKATLIAERGVTVSISAIWEMLHKLDLRHKKSRSGPRSKSAPTSPSVASAGKSGNASWPRLPSSSSTKRARRPT